MKPADYSPVDARSLPYLDLAALGARPVPVHSYFDGDDWHLWFPTNDPKKLQPMQTGGIIEGTYLAKAPARGSDLHSAFVEFFEKSVAVSGVRPFLTAILNDVFNMAASLTKLQLLVDSGVASPHAFRLVLTEVEYLVIVCRTVFDLVQEVLHRFWASVTFKDGVKRRSLPQTFGKVVLHEDATRSAQEMRDRFQLTDALSRWYEAHAPFFLCLRHARDLIVHSPKSEEIIFFDDCRFLVQARGQLFSECVAWSKCEPLRNGLGPLNFALAEWLMQTLHALETLPAAILRNIASQPDYAPDHHIFIRSTHLGALAAVKRILELDPWGNLRYGEAL